jgi:hypothetical protein
MSDGFADCYDSGSLEQTGYSDYYSRDVATSTDVKLKKDTELREKFGQEKREFEAKFGKLPEKRFDSPQAAILAAINDSWEREVVARTAPKLSDFAKPLAIMLFCGLILASDMADGAQVAAQDLRDTTIPISMPKDGVWSAKLERQR